MLKLSVFPSIIVMVVLLKVMPETTTLQEAVLSSTVAVIVVSPGTKAVKSAIRPSPLLLSFSTFAILVSPMLHDTSS